MQYKYIFKLNKKNKMKYYYYEENNEPLGPFTFDELKTKRLKKSTMVWTDGMSKWDYAENIAEINQIIIPEPPPLTLITNSAPLIPVEIFDETQNESTPPSDSSLISNKKELSIDKSFLKSILFGLLLGFITVFIAEHFMKVQYYSSPSSIQSNSPYSSNYARQEQSNQQQTGTSLGGRIADSPSFAKQYRDPFYTGRQISLGETHDVLASGKAIPKGGVFITPFGTTITVDADKWNNKKYNNEFDYYFKKKLTINMSALFSDILFVGIFGLIYSVIIFLALKFRFKFS